MATMEVPPTQTVYVNNIETKINKQELKKSLYGLFSQCGPILEIVAMKTPKMRGQAFIVYKDANSAGTAIRALQGFLFYDKPIRIAYAKSKSDAVAMLDGTYVDKLKAQGKKKDDKKTSVTRRERKAGTANSPSHILFVEKIPPNTTDVMLSMVFQQFPGFKEVRLVPGKDGIAFVEFESEFLSAVAMQSLQGFKLTPEHSISISFAKR